MHIRYRKQAILYCFAQDRSADSAMRPVNVPALRTGASDEDVSDEVSHEL